MGNNVHTFTPATDIYALGATLFKMLTGHTPPTASHILNKGLPLDELKEKGVNANIVQLVTHCMSPLCDDRYQTVRDFQADLKRVYRGTPEEETEIDKDKEKSAKSVEKNSHDVPPATRTKKIFLLSALLVNITVLLLLLYYLFMLISQ